MKKTTILLILSALTALGQQPRTYTGIITDSMCGADHTMMKVAPDAKCARDCVKSSTSIKFVLNDGKNSYRLSDQATPAQFAGQKVKVTGALFPKTGIIAVQKIEAVK